MAAITSANVTVLDSYVYGSKASKGSLVRRTMAIVLAGQGATAGDIPASALGFKQITTTDTYAAYVGATWVGNGITFVANVGQDNNYIFPIDLLQATDANRATPANITGTIYVIVEGIPN